MMMISASVVTVSLVSAELREAEYDLVDMCTTDEPQTLVKKESKLHCAVAGIEQRSYREFTFDATTKDCSLYRHKPLFYEAGPGCVGYQARQPMKM